MVPPLSKLVNAADRVQFSAQRYHDDGFCVIQSGLSAVDLEESLASARAIAKRSAGEFVRLTGSIDADRRNMIKLLDSVKRFLFELYNGVKLPRSDAAPYGFHNMVQIAIRDPGARGQDGIRSLQAMRQPSVGHVDQPHKRQNPRGQPLCNFSCLVGFLLQGDTYDRDDAGNFWASRGSHILLGKAFKDGGETPAFYTPISEHFLHGVRVPNLEAVRMAPGQVVIAHHQLLHAVGPNKSSTPRVQVYFRITASNRPNGSVVSYPAAMKDPLLELPRLLHLAKHQNEQLCIAQLLRKPLREASCKLRSLSRKQRVLVKKRGRRDRPPGVRAKLGWERKPSNQMSKLQRIAKRPLDLAQ